MVTKTYEVGVGAPNGGVAITIPDGGGQATQLARSVIHVKGLNPRGKIKDVNVGVRIQHPFAKDIEIYLASPRGVINLSHDVGGDGNNYGAGFGELRWDVHDVRQQHADLDRHARAAGSVRRVLRPDGEPQSAQRARGQEGDQCGLVAAGRGRRQRAPGGNARVLVPADQDDQPEK